VSPVTCGWQGRLVAEPISCYLSVMDRPTTTLPPLIEAMLNPAWYDHPVEQCRLIETHISWVILTGHYAYKVKKPLDLGFLDFSTLEKRRFFCEEELRLNRRLAPSIYLAVVAIDGTAQAPVLGGDGEPIEYAVKMVQFPQQAQLDRMLAAARLQPEHLDAFAKLVADFHRQAAVAGGDSPYGDTEHVWQPVAENFAQIRDRIHSSDALTTLAVLEQWSEAAFTELTPLLQQRKADGFIRECHGDMHLRNLAWIDEAAVAFDGIEFNANLRWIDVISEVAFLVMDLQDRGEAPLAQRFLNAYLERSGDYAGLGLLRFYLVYRALVRAKVAAIRLVQAGLPEAERVAAEAEFSRYLVLAEGYTRRTSPQLLLTRGLSGSGKTTLSQPLLEQLPAIRIRSDVERKRLYGMRAEEDAHAAPTAGIYSSEATARTYGQLLSLAAGILQAGYSVIVDATFLKRAQREPFRQLAAEKGAGFVLLDLIAAPELLRQRLVQRKGDASDADLAVLAHQLEAYAPLDEDERKACISLDTGRPLDVAALLTLIKLQGED
jgi:aminoglycoside phosphotransferase family enzyme/predicted kinase